MSYWVSQPRVSLLRVIQSSSSWVKSQSVMQSICQSFTRLLANRACLNYIQDTDGTIVTGIQFWSFLVQRNYSGLFENTGNRFKHDWRINDMSDSGKNQTRTITSGVQDFGKNDFFFLIASETWLTCVWDLNILCGTKQSPLAWNKPPGWP